MQLFACFTKAADYKKKGGYDAAFVHVQDMVRYLRQQQERYSEDLALAYSWNDVDRNDFAGRISAIMTCGRRGNFKRSYGAAGRAVSTWDQAYDTGMEL